MRPRPATSTPRCCRIFERVLGAEHPDTLATRGQPCLMGRQGGDAAAARDQYAALLPIRQRVRARAPGHPDLPRQPGPLEQQPGDAEPGVKVHSFVNAALKNPMASSR